MKKHVLTGIFICLFFSGCALKGPDTISILVDKTLHGTITVDKDEIRFGEVLEITAIPEKGYFLNQLSPEGAVADPYDSTKYYYIPNSGETPKRYEAPITSITIKGIFDTRINKTENFSVISNLEHGTIVVDGDSKKKHAGDIVTFTLFVDEGFNLEKDSLKICYGEYKLDYECSDDNKYTFEMPESSVFVEAKIINDLYLNVDDCVFAEKGKDLVIDVINITNYTTFDAYITTGQSDSDQLFAKDVVIENNKITIPTANMEEGYFYFYLLNESLVLSNVIKIKIGYAGYTEEWTSAFVTDVKYFEDSFTVNFEPALPRVLLKYRLENDSTEEEKCFSNTYKTIIVPFEKTEEEQKLIFRIYDPYLKIVSKEYSLVVPAKEPENPENPEGSDDSDDTDNSDDSDDSGDSNDGGDNED